MLENGAARPAEPPLFDDVLDYLQAFYHDLFYHGLDVKEYTPTLTFNPWEAKPKPKRSPQESSFIGLQDASTASSTRIQTRSPSPAGRFSLQLNPDDLLDAAISIQPRDAYALLLLVDHDLYEDEDDGFCCGRTLRRQPRGLGVLGAVQFAAHGQRGGGSLISGSCGLRPTVQRM